MNHALYIGITVPKALFGMGSFTLTKVLFLTKLDLTKNLRPSKFQSGVQRNKTESHGFRKNVLSFDPDGPMNHRL